MIESYIKAGYPAIVVETPEENRALKEIKRIAENLELEVALWTSTKGFIDGLNGRNESCKDPVSALNMASELMMEDTVYILLDFHPYISSPDVWRLAKDMFKEQKSRGITFIFVSPQFKVPLELEREMVVTDLPLPGREDLEKIMNDIAEAAETEPPENKNDVLDAALGLTITEAENAFALSLVEKEGFDAFTIARVKENIVRKSGVLEIFSPDTNMESIGGLDNLKNWLKNRVSAFSPEAQAYGLPAPKGCLLVGVPGCGKSLSARALAAEWKKPLLRLDAGRLFGSLVGESEKNTRRALEIAEAVAPAVLWLDEVEKGLAGVQSSGRSDGGVTARVFGQFLTWLQEKKSPVFVVATANAVEQLPPEFLRKGRFDEIFFVDLPSKKEREEIFKVQLNKRNRNPEDFNISELAKATNKFTGAEIEEAVVAGMFAAWNDGRREVTTADILSAAGEITPMTVGMADRIDSLRSWAENSARMANSVEKKSSGPARIIRNRG
jgi:SpoVK/Ycf46/Vps4 family AAA+-type ATPase